MSDDSKSANYGDGDTSYQAAGAEPGLRALVDDFYELMGSDPRFATIWNMHPPDKSMSRDKLTLFLCGWLGGPKLYREKYGSIGIPRVHAHLPITEREKQQWLTCMGEAVAKQPFAEAFKRYLLVQLEVPAEAIRRRCAKSTLS